MGLRAIGPLRALSKGPRGPRRGSSKEQFAERAALDPTSELWGAHRSRYRFAGGFVRGQVVLDAACGTGFGLEMLHAAGATCVVGVDTSAEAVTLAREHFQREGLHLLQADVAYLPFRAECFGIVASFETLEHLPSPLAGLKELERVLKPDGLLLLSTPNRLWGEAEEHSPPNPYHVSMFAPEELRHLLSQVFPRVTLLGQRVTPHYQAVPFLLKGKARGWRSLYALRLLPWKLLNRLPYAIKDYLASRFTRRHFYPSEADYIFDEDAVAETYNLLAICQKLGYTADG